MFESLYHICKLVISTRKALHSNSGMTFNNDDYISRTSCRFIFMEIFNQFRSYNIHDWYEKCKKKGLTDIYLVIQDLECYCAICVWKNGKKTCFYPTETREDGYCNIIYQEFYCNVTVPVKGGIEENVSRICDVFNDLYYFSIKLDSCFKTDSLFKEYIDYFKQNKSTLIKDPEQHLEFIIDIYDYCFISKMGTWGDCGYGRAQLKGLLEEFTELNNRASEHLNRFLMEMSTIY